MIEHDLTRAINYSTDMRLGKELRTHWFRIVRKLHAKRSAEQVREMEIVRGLV